MAKRWTSTSTISIYGSQVPRYLVYMFVTAYAVSTKWNLVVAFAAAIIDM